MADNFQFVSTFPVQDCTQRLQRLAAQEHLYSDSGFFATHFRIQASEFVPQGEQEAAFEFDILGSLRGSRGIPVLLYFKLTGALRSEEGATQVSLQHRLQMPTSAGDWAFVLFVYVILALALAGGVIIILVSPWREGLFFGAALLLVGLAYSWLHIQVHDQARANIPRWVHRALTDGASSSDQTTSGAPDWISTISK